jgi:hypothetical protein
MSSSIVVRSCIDMAHPFALGRVSDRNLSATH